MSVKLVNGYDVPQEGGLDYQGFGSYGAAARKGGQQSVVDYAAASRCRQRWADYNRYQAAWEAARDAGQLYAPMPPPNCNPNTGQVYKSIFGDEASVTGRGRVVNVSGLAGMALDAFYGARLKTNPLYNTLPDSAYGDYGDCGCNKPATAGYGFFGAAAMPKAKEAPAYATRAAFIAATAPKEAGVAIGQPIAGTAKPSGGSTATNNDVVDGRGLAEELVRQQAERDAAAAANAPTSSGMNPMVLLGVAAIGAGLLFFKKKK